MKKIKDRFKADGARIEKNLYKRAAIIRAIRGWFENEDFLEVQTPLLVPTHGMETHLFGFESEFKNIPGEKERFHNLSLPTSPEFHMKRLLVAGLPKIFQISKCFRNGELSSFHEPEFTMLEWYRAGEEYSILGSDLENIIRTAVGAVKEIQIKTDAQSEQDDSPDSSNDAQKNTVQNTPKYNSNSGDMILNLQDGDVDFGGSFERLTVKEAFKQFTDFDFPGIRNHSALLNISDKLNLECPASLRKAINQNPSDSEMDFLGEDLFNFIFLNVIEQELGREKPTILYEYPAEMCALSQISHRDPSVCERMELYINGVELANGFGELTDPDEQKTRFQKSIDARREIYGMETPEDEGFLDALDEGLPESSGMALGIDRLVMVLLGEEAISNVISFGFEDQFPQIK